MFIAATLLFMCRTEKRTKPRGTFPQTKPGQKVPNYGKPSKNL